MGDVSELLAMGSADALAELGTELTYCAADFAERRIRAVLSAPRTYCDTQLGAQMIVSSISAVVHAAALPRAPRKGDRAVINGVDWRVSAVSQDAAGPDYLVEFSRAIRP